MPWVVIHIDSLAGRPLPDNVLDLIAGQVPGAVVSRSSGAAGAQSVVYLRNLAGLGPLEPALVVVDGLPALNGVAAIAPSDVESIEVSPGVAASAAYGWYAGGGVIAIRTRRGGAGRPRLRIHAQAEMRDLSRDLAQARSTTLLATTDGRYCTAVPNTPLCNGSVDWTAELLRANGGASAPPALLAGGGVPTDPWYANRFQAGRWLAPTFDLTRQLLPPEAVSTAAADFSAAARGASVYAGVSRDGAGAPMRYGRGYERWNGRLNVDAGSGALRISLRAFGTRGTNPGDFYDADVQFWPGVFSPAANLLGRDSLGRLYQHPDLQHFAGFVVQNPLAGTPPRLLDERLAGSLALTYAVRPWVTLDVALDHDRLDATQPFIHDFWSDAWSAVSSRSAGASVRWRAGSIRATSTARLGWLRLASDRQDNSAQLGPAGVPVIQAFQGVHEETHAAFWQIGTSAAAGERVSIDALVRHDEAQYWPSALSGRAGVAWAAVRRGGSAVLTLRGAWGSVQQHIETSSLPNLADLTASLTGVGILPGASGPRIEEIEAGADAALPHDARLSLTFARSHTSRAWIPVSIAGSNGFGGSILEGFAAVTTTSLELALDVPVLRRPNARWDWRLTYARANPVLAGTAGPALQYGNGTMLAKAGERVGALYGQPFVTSCAQLPAAFVAQCGDGRPFQRNDEGYVVWVGQNAAGQAYSWRDGITRNLWGATLPGAAAPWGGTLAWGRPFLASDPACTASCAPLSVRLGQLLPDWRFSVGSTFTSGPWRLYGLVEGAIGGSLYDLGRQLDYAFAATREQDQEARTPQTAKPLGYGLSLAAFVAPNSVFVRDASFAKLREASIGLRVGRVAGGDLALLLVGRNLFTLTRYPGLDPEAGLTGADGMISGMAPLSLPQLRSIGLQLTLDR